MPPSRWGPRGALERRRRAASLSRALREWVGGRLDSLGVQQRLPRQWRPPLGAAALPGGGGPQRARRGRGAGRKCSVEVGAQTKRPALVPARGGRRNRPHQGDLPAPRQTGPPRQAPEGGRRYDHPSPPARLTHRQPAVQRPSPGAAKRPRPNKYTLGGMRRRRGGDWAGGHRPCPRRREVGNHDAILPLPSPHSPPLARGRPETDHRGAGPPPPPRQGGRPPSPRKGHGARGGGTLLSPYATPPGPPPACSQGGRDRQANPRQRTRAPHGPRPGTTREHEKEQYGGPALRDQSNAKDTCFVACPSKAKRRTEVGQPAAPRGPPVSPPGRAAHRPPPPRPPGAGTTRTCGPAPTGAHNPKPGKGEKGPGRPHPKQAKQSTGAM